MSVSLVALAVAVSGNPMAQSLQQPNPQQPSLATSPDDEPYETLEDVLYTLDETQVVVVRGRRETIARLPNSAQSIVPDGIATLDQLATIVPGVWLVNDQDPGTNILSIRGATTDRLQQASVAVVLDDVPLADTELFTAALFDVRKIDVLRGPQGALFGRNAAGGVIGFTTGDSGQDNSLATFSLGNGGRVGVEAVAPLGSFGPADDARVSLLATHADGWINNRTLDKTVDETGTLAARISLSGDTNSWRWNVRSHALWEEGGAAWASSNNVTGLNGGKLDGAVLTDPIGDFEGSAKRRWFQVSGRALRDMAGGELRLIAAHDIYAKRWVEELDYRPGPLTFFGFPAFPNGIQPISQPIDIRATTLDARWSRQGQRFDVMLGAFWQDTFKGRVDDFGPLLFGSAPPAYDTGSEQSALYAVVTYRPFDQLSLEAQARLDRDVRRQVISNSVNGVALDNREATFERVSPRIGAVWTFSNQANAYVSWSEAFRPGGFNPAPAANSIWQIGYRPEVTQSREVGFRWAGSLQDVRLKASIAAFDNTVTDWQNYTFIDNQSVTLNVPDVAISGVEMDILVRSGEWQAGAAVATLDAQIGRFIATDPLLGSPATRDYTAKRIPNVPDLSGNLWFEYEIDAGFAMVTPRFTIRHAGQTFYEIDNALVSPARTWFDASIIVQPASDWTLTLRGENITDERWAVSAFGQGMTGLLAGLGPGGPFDTFTINRGAVWTAELRYEF